MTEHSPGAKKCPAIPATVAGFTPRWLTEALGADRAGLVVESAEPVDFIHGASSKIRMQLRTTQPEFPRRIIIKGGFEEHSRDMLYMHRMEVHAYRELVPAVRINSPHCFFAATDDAGHSVVILEDLRLRDVRFQSLLRPIGFDLAASFLDELARLHARWWGSPELEAGGAMEWAPDIHGAGVGRYFALLTNARTFSQYCALPRGAAIPALLHDAARIERAHTEMRDLYRSAPRTMIHGDLHLGNLYTDPGGAPAFLDWHPRRAPWVIDVSYFMIAALDTPNRRTWERGLLEHYLSKLSQLGVDAPKFPDAWLAYRRHVVWGLVIWLLNGSEFQTESNNTAAASRFGAAMVDLDTFGAIGV